MSARFAYTVFCDRCGWQEHGEAWSDTALMSDPLDDLELFCPNCGPLDWVIARRIPTSRKVELRQLAKPRTPIHGTPRRRD